MEVMPFCSYGTPVKVTSMLFSFSMSAALTYIGGVDEGRAVKAQIGEKAAGVLRGPYIHAKPAAGQEDDVIEHFEDLVAGLVQDRNDVGAFPRQFSEGSNHRLWLGPLSKRGSTSIQKYRTRTLHTLQIMKMKSIIDVM